MLLVLTIPIDFLPAGQGIQAAVSVHSYGNVIIFPWGYKEARHPNKVRSQANDKYMLHFRVRGKENLNNRENRHL